MITPDNIAGHELVGLEAEVAASANADLVGLNGTVMDETKSMLRIRTARGPKSAPKAGCTWRFSTGPGDALVDGSLISKRPHDRTGRR